jgi:hypothetical protein
MGCRARLLIQIRIEYSRGEASGMKYGRGATDQYPIRANPINLIPRNLSQLCWVGHVAIRAGRATPAWVVFFPAGYLASPGVTRK